MSAPELVHPPLAPAWREANFLQGLGAVYGTLPPQPVAEPHWVARTSRPQDP